MWATRHHYLSPFPKFNSQVVSRYCKATKKGNGDQICFGIQLYLINLLVKYLHFMFGRRNSGYMNACNGRHKVSFMPEFVSLDVCYDNINFHLLFRFYTVIKYFTVKSGEVKIILITIGISNVDASRKNKR